MLISAHFQAVISSRLEGRRTKTHVSRRLSCCNEESIEVLGLQSGVGGDQLCLQLAHKVQRGTFCPADVLCLLYFVHHFYGARKYLHAVKHSEILEDWVSAWVKTVVV